MKAMILKKTSKCITLFALTTLFTTNYLSPTVYATNSTYTINQEYSNEDYVSRKTALENKKGELDVFIADIDKTLQEAVVELNDNYNELIINQNSYIAKKNIKGETANNDTLKMIDMVLGSENVSDFFKNLDLAKTVIVRQNKELKQLKEQEKDLLSQQTKINNNIEKLEQQKQDVITELTQVNENIKSIENALSRKGDIHYNSQNLSELSNISLEDAQIMLSGTALYELAPTYIEAEQTYKVNAIFLMALCANESNWGTSKRAIEDNNLTGFGVYNSSSKGINSSTKRDSVMRTAKCLGNEYLQSNGLFYKGVSIQDVNSSYAINEDGSVNTEWAKTIDRITNQLVTKLK